MSNAMNTEPLREDKALRKAWLKQKFASFEYHEEMLRVHRAWLDVLRRALERAEKDMSPNRPISGYTTIADEARNFRTETMPLIERNDDLGKYRKEEWPKFGATATFRSIPDYGRYLLSEGDMLQWMTPQEDQEIGPLWGKMDRMVQNIKYTVDGIWERDPQDTDWILDEQYTGPIDWPADWREQVIGAQAGVVPVSSLRIKAGEPVPQDGLWQAIGPDPQALEVRAGDVLPDLGFAYGLTVWQKVR